MCRTNTRCVKGHDFSLAASGVTLIALFLICFVSGHDLSRAVRSEKDPGLSPCEPQGSHHRRHPLGPSAKPVSPLKPSVQRWDNDPHPALPDEGSTRGGPLNPYAGRIYPQLYVFPRICGFSTLLKTLGGGGRGYQFWQRPTQQLRDLIDRHSQANEKGAERRVHGAYFIETHLVDQLFELQRIGGKQIDPPFPVIEADRASDDLLHLAGVTASDHAVRFHLFLSMLDVLGVEVNRFPALA